MPRRLVLGHQPVDLRRVRRSQPACHHVGRLEYVYTAQRYEASKVNITVTAEVQAPAAGDTVFDIQLGEQNASHR